MADRCTARAAASDLPALAHDVGQGRARAHHLILYFAADRFATNGDAQIGFWFLQDDDVALTANGFTGEHKEGDILILSDFTNGGTIGEVHVCTWVGGDGAAGSLDCPDASVSEVGSTDVYCTSDDVACATISQGTGTTGSAWPFDPKQGPNDRYALGAFFEGGVNATELLGRTPCFASFLVETRSSQEATAELKDLIFGELDICQPAVDVCKQCNVTLVDVGDTVALQVNYSGWACNTGNVDLSVDLSDDVDGVLLDDAALASETCVGFSGDYQPSSTPDGDPTAAEFTDTVTLTGSHPDLDDIVLEALATCGTCSSSDVCPAPPFAIP